MSDSNSITFESINDYCEETGDSRSKVYADIAEGTMIGTIKTGKRSARFVKDESTAIKCARAAGATKEELMELVAEIKATRKVRLKKALEALGIEDRWSEGSK